MACKDGCKNSILNGQKSVIGEPICHDNCGSETDCEGIQTYSDCVGVNPALECIDTPANTSLSDVLVALDTKLCQTQQSSCTVSTDANDTCCGYLGDKLIAGTGVTITKNIATASSGCKTLTISTSCFTWNNILPSNSTGTGNFRNKWQSIGSGFQLAQYSNVKECTIKLRGTVVISGYNNSKEIIAVLPVAPLSIKRFSVNILASSGFKPSVIDIYPDGSVKLFTVPNLSDSISVSLDGISFETV
jgi:hypothetical protein